MPILSISWPDVKAKFDGSTKILALTDRQISLLSTLAEQLTWEKTFRTPDYDWSDKDELDQEVQDLIRWLTMPVDLQEIVGYVDEIEDLLRALQNVSSCCNPEDWTDGDQYTEPIDEDSTNGVPQHFVDAGWATDTNDWDGFQDFQCQVANVLVNDLKAKVTQLEDVFDTAGALIIGLGAIAALIGMIFGSGVTLLVGGILASVGATSRLWERLQSGGADAVPSEEEIELSRDDLVCAWVDDNNDGVDDRIDAWHVAIDDAFNLVESEILKALQPKSILKAMYTGKWSDDVVTKDIAQKMVDAGIEPGTYTCDCTSTPVGEIYGIRGTLQRMNSEHSNNTLHAFDALGSSGGIFDSGGRFCTRAQAGGGTVAGVDLSPTKTFAWGNAACIADTDSDFEITATVRTPAVRDGDYFELQSDNLSTSKRMEIKCVNFEVWISDDSGVTGTWWSASISKRGGDDWTVTAYNVERNYTGGDSEINLDILAD